MTETPVPGEITSRFSKGVDALNERVGRTVAWLSLAMVVLVTADVLLRYACNKSFVATQELEWHLFSAIFLLGAGYTLRHGSHVRVDVVYQRLTRRTKAIVNLIGCLFFLFPGCYLVIKTSLPFVHASWAMGEGSPDPGGLPARYLLKLLIPAGFGLLALQGVALALDSVKEFLNRPWRNGAAD